jgi:hypothetical protein
MTLTLPNSGGYSGQAWQQTRGSDFNALDFVIRQIIAGKAFTSIVQVKSVTAGGTSYPSIVSVQPMVNQVDGFGNSQAHGTIYNIPCFRLQSGLGAVILDPIVGDIGVAIMCDRDISNVKATKEVSNPGTFRHHSWSDGIYFGSVLGGPVSQYVQITQAGISVQSTGTISLSAGGGYGISITSSGTTIDGRLFLTHEHSGVQSGSSSTGHVV